MPYEIFSNAPIAEAVLEVLVSLPKETSVDDLVKYPEVISARFSRIGKRMMATMELKGANLQGKVSPRPMDNQVVGHFLRSDEEKKVIQSRLNGFAFSKLKPYENWTAFSSEARNLWSNYVTIAKPISISKLSLRYVNRIEVPLPFSDFSEYILVNPQIAPDLPQALSNFFMRIEVPIDSSEALVVVIVALDKRPVDSKILPVILDIDVSRNVVYSDNFERIWENFETLRNIKNEFFFKSLTAKAKGLFR